MPARLQTPHCQLLLAVRRLVEWTSMWHSMSDGQVMGTHFLQIGQTILQKYWPSLPSLQPFCVSSRQQGVDSSLLCLFTESSHLFNLFLGLSSLDSPARLLPGPLAELGDGAGWWGVAPVLVDALHSLSNAACI